MYSARIWLVKLLCNASAVWATLLIVNLFGSNYGYSQTTWEMRACRIRLPTIWSINVSRFLLPNIVLAQRLRQGLIFWWLQYGCSDNSRDKHMLHCGWSETYQYNTALAIIWNPHFPSLLKEAKTTKILTHWSWPYLIRHPPPSFWRTLIFVGYFILRCFMIIWVVMYIKTKFCFFLTYNVGKKCEWRTLLISINKRL